MSRRGLCALAALALATPASAQEPRAARSRVERLERALAWAEGTARRIDSLERGRADPLETVTAGALEVRTPARLISETRVATTRAWSLLDSAFGSAAGRLAGHPFTLLVMRGDELLPKVPAANGVLTTGTESDISWRLLWSAATELRNRSDTALRSWMGGAMMPERDASREQRSVYIALVTAPSPAVRRCYSRDLAACRLVLGFTPVADAITEWYDVDRRRVVVAELDNLEQVRSARGAARACVEQRSDADCIAILRRVPAGAVPAPLPAAARINLVRHAVAVGGRDAYERLLATVGRPLEQRLAAASGLSAETLLGDWHAAILAARPSPVTVAPRGAWMALGWGVAFALLALRSSRWR